MFTIEMGPKPRLLKVVVIIHSMIPMMPKPLLHHICDQDEKLLFVLKNCESSTYLPSMHCKHLSYPSSYLIKVISYLDIVQDHLFYLDGSKDPRSWSISPNLSQRQSCNFPSIFLHVQKLGLMQKLPPPCSFV